MPWWYLATPLLFLAAFFGYYRTNRASLVPSFLFTGFLLTMTGFLLAYVIYYNNSVFLRVPLAALLFVGVLIAAFGLYALIAFLLLNAWSILKKETRTLAHCLTLILGIALVLYVIAVNVINVSGWPPFALVWVYWIVGMVSCYAVHVTQYVVATVLCNVSHPQRNQDYIIVLGTGLRNGNVSPLLAKRVDRAIAFYARQKEAGAPPKLIVSGGQGRDESRSEAEAMADYARGKGIPDSQLLLESKSENTLQNMRFSKEIMDEDSKGKPYRVIYATSNYHLLRAGIYARRAGLKISGIGSGTAFYYLPVALLREYIAYVVLYKKRNIAFVVFGFVLSCAWVVLVLYGV